MYVVCKSYFKMVFFKIRVGKFKKLRQNQQLKDDAMFVYLCWTQSVASFNMRETLWNYQKIQTKNFDWWLVKTHEIYDIEVMVSDNWKKNK